MSGYFFKRYELKYILTPSQYRAVRAEIEKRLEADEFGENAVQSLYLDTADDRLIRESIEKPIFKEKLRFRCYNLNENDGEVFVEMKRKYDGVVYKRRLACKESEALGIASGLKNTQIGKELGYFFSFYGDLRPKVMILYDREAFLDKSGDLRVTFDRNVRYRKDELNFHTSLDGDPLLKNGEVLMELKTGTAFPLWLCELLDKEQIRKTSFSKYGTAYKLEHEKDERKGGKILCLNRSSLTEPSLQPASSSL